MQVNDYDFFFGISVLENYEWEVNINLSYIYNVFGKLDNFIDARL